jgi:hypothetical protein
MKVLVGLFVCMAVVAASIFVLVSQIDFVGCDEPDVADSTPAEGLGAVEMSSVDDFPVPSLAEEDDCDVDFEDLGYAIDPDEYVDYLLPPDVTPTQVIAWYLGQGIVGQPFGAFEWCGSDDNAMEWVNPAEPQRYLDVVVAVEDPEDGGTPTDPTQLIVSISDRPVAGSDGPTCPQQAL